MSSSVPVTSTEKVQAKVREQLKESPNVYGKKVVRGHPVVIAYGLSLAEAMDILRDTPGALDAFIARTKQLADDIAGSLRGHGGLVAGDTFRVHRCADTLFSLIRQLEEEPEGDEEGP